jgi:tetratricopeptide (TPR) repeat protein
MNLMKTVEPDGIIFSSSDHSTFPLIYLQSVEGIRPDVVIADKYGYVEKHLYEGMPGELTSRFRNIPTPQERSMIERWIIENNNRPIYFTKKRDMRDLPGLELVPWGLAYKLVRKTDRMQSQRPDLWSSYELRCLDNENAHMDYSAHSILGDYHFARGREYLHDGKPQEALSEFAVVAEHGQGVKEVLNNLGSVCAENGLVRDSIGYYQRAVEIDPTYLLALRNLSKLHEHLGDYAKAIDYQKRVLSAGPEDYQGTFQLATLYELMGDDENAILTYRKSIEMKPQDFRPFRALGFIYLSLADLRHRAPAMFVESLKRNPKQPDLEKMLVRLRGDIRS